jgi:hypothetical protein
MRSVRKDRRAVVNLVDGSTIVGRPTWSWRPGVYRIASARIIDPKASGAERDRAVDGIVEIPRARVSFVQFVTG